MLSHVGVELWLIPGLTRHNTGRLSGEDAHQGIKERGRLHGLSEKGGEFIHPLFDFAASQRGQHDERELGVGCLEFTDLPGQRKTVHVWHLHIKNGHVKRSALTHPVKGFQRQRGRLRQHLPGFHLPG